MIKSGPKPTSMRRNGSRESVVLSIVAKNTTRFQHVLSEDRFVPNIVFYDQQPAVLKRVRSWRCRWSTGFAGRLMPLWWFDRPAPDQQFSTRTFASDRFGEKTQFRRESVFRAVPPRPVEMSDVGT
jgi:hypothetical protein